MNLTGPAIIEYAGISRRQLDHWTNCGHLRAHGPAAGDGAARAFEPGEDQIARWMGLLVRHGVTPDAAATVARDLHATGRARLGLFEITTATPTVKEFVA